MPESPTTKTDRPRRPGTEVPAGAEREERPDKPPADRGEHEEPTEHEGATEDEVGDRTGPGAGYDIPEMPDPEEPST